MKKVIHKYPMEGRISEIELPYGACVLCAGVQGQDIVLWVEVFADRQPRAPQRRTFRAMATGEVSTAFEGMAYINTVQVKHDDGEILVWHIYEDVQ